ncbi:MAG TPA: hypothetical protein VN937_18150 [Blastocatellia bacterium]|nr:hypothetical protein [Blastocatellia bacterium]
MFVPDEIRKCVAFVGYRQRNGIPQLAGTAFFLIRPIDNTELSFEYTVTAKHVIDNIRDKGVSEVLLRVNMAGGSAQWIATSLNRWTFHPDESEVDVAIYRSVLPEEIDNRYFPLNACATDEVVKTVRIGLGDEVVIPGLFAHHHGQHRNVPIVRIGNIAALPEEKIESQYGMMDAYLVEARSIGGLSGSPVFAHVPVPLRSLEGFHTSSETQFCLIGLMQGHWDSRLSQADSALDAYSGSERVNVGIGIVVPATKILEVINQPTIQEDEERQRQELRKKRLPKLD